MDVFSGKVNREHLLGTCDVLIEIPPPLLRLSPQFCYNISRSSLCAMFTSLFLCLDPPTPASLVAQYISFLFMSFFRLISFNDHLKLF